MIWNSLLGLAGNVVTGVIDKQKAKSERKLVEIKAETEIKKKQIAGELDFDIQALKSGEESWKDEAWTILFILIVLGAMLPFTQDAILRGFEILGQTPQWFQFCIYGAIASSFGLRSLSKFGKK
tara:strand:+ start:1505 stop:1876 length:372 start_codon:yes stop_codon:yes gene_type:complete